MTTFNPFEKEIRELEFSDLETLKENKIPEGVYIEYKSDLPDKKKIANSIASFANMYGGWYIIGIKTDDDNVPNDFPGFKLSKHPNPKETIRNIAVSHINPFPLFDSKLIKVDDKRVILAVLVHESLEPPHITKDGRIYRRNGEGGDPVAENDRYAIDRLYDKSKRFKEIVEDFCQNKIVIPEAQSQQGWLEIYLMTYPLGKLSIDNFFMKEYIDSVKSLLDRQSTIPPLKELYLFSWENLPRGDIDRLLRFLVDDLDIRWATDAKILIFDFYKTICIFKDENSVEIKIDAKKEKATLKISDGRTHDLKVKEENGKLNIYKEFFFDGTGNIPFNNVATSSNSIIFRQTTPDNLVYLTPTFEFYMNGNAKVIIPFQYIDFWDLPQFYEGSENLKLLREALDEEVTFFRVIDGFNLFLHFFILLTKYYELLKREEWNEKLIIKYRLENCWRSILFFDSKTFTEHIEKYGIPVSQKDVIVIPDTLSGDNWFIKSFDYIIEPDALTDFVSIAMSLGFHLGSFVRAIAKDLVQYSKKSQEFRESESDIL